MLREVVLAPEAEIVDVDDTFLAGLTVELNTTVQDTSYEILRLNQTLVSECGLESLPFVDRIGFVLNGIQSIECYEDILHSLTYENSDRSGNPESGPRILIVTPYGIGTGPGQEDILQIDFFVVNNPPVLDPNGNISLSTYNTTFTEESPSGVPVLASDFILVDVDNTELASVSITLLPLLDHGLEYLEVNSSTSSSIVVTRPTDNVVTLHGSPLAPIAEFKAVLFTVEYINMADELTGDVRNVEFVVSDSANSSSAFSIVNLIHVNDAPVLRLDGDKVHFFTFYTENGPDINISSDPVLEDTDSNEFTALLIQSIDNRPGDALITGQQVINGSTEEIFPTPINATMVASLLSSLKFTNFEAEPPAGNRSFCFEIFDTISWSNQACVTISFIPVNDNSPVFMPDSYIAAVDEESINTKVVQVFATDADFTNSPGSLQYLIIAGDSCHNVQGGSGFDTSDLANLFSGDGSTNPYISADEPCHFGISSNGIIYTTTSPPNREEQDSYLLTVIVSDGRYTDYAQVDITILDVFDSPPCIVPRVYNASIPLNAPAGFEVVQLVVSDPDLNDEASFSFNYTMQVPNIFELDPNT